MADQSEAVVPAVDRVLNIFEYIAARNEPVSVREIAGALHIPQTSAFRLVKQLLLRGYLDEDLRNPGFFRLGLQLLTISGSVGQVNHIRDVARTDMYQLAIESQQAVQLGVFKGSEVMYIEQYLPPNPMTIYTAPYSVLPLNISASGKVLAAYLPEQERSVLLNDVIFTKRTQHTIEDKEAFSQHLEIVKKQGYAVDDEEFSLGVGCLAAPIYGFDGRCVAALGITGHIHNYHERGDQLASMVVAYAKRISAKLGC